MPRVHRPLAESLAGEQEGNRNQRRWLRLELWPPSKFLGARTSLFLTMVKAEVGEGADRSSNEQACEGMVRGRKGKPTASRRLGAHLC